MKIVASLLFGFAATLGLFFGVSHVGHRMEAPTIPPAVDVREVVLPIEPPPPPAPVRQAVQLQTVPLGIEASPEPSPVKIEVPPPLVEAVLPPAPPAPPAVVQIGDLAGHYKPSIGVFEDDGRVFQASEVDQLPRALDRHVAVPSRVRNGADSLRVVLVVVVDANGIPSHPRLLGSSGNDKFDRIMMDCILDWTFSPAIRKGKRVRCLIQQNITVNWSGANQFTI
ncbi:MAG TPA: TonB family protein [Opitutaceae bacterium]|jgi:TonB family protein